MKKPGLSRHSPVRLELNRDNYEALIERHGQTVRWLQAQKCTCILENNRPNPDCERCNGNGWEYTFQFTYRKAIEMDAVAPNMLRASNEKIVALHSVENTIPGSSHVIGTEFVSIGGFPPLAVGMRYSCVVTVDTRVSRWVTGAHLGGGLCLIDITRDTSEQQVPTEEIVEVEAVHSMLSSEEYTPVSHAGQYVKLGGQELEELLPGVGEPLEALVTTVRYPKFLVTGQNFREADQRVLAEMSASAMMSTPAFYQVGEQDIVTLLAGQQFKNRVIVRDRMEDIDRIPEWWVSGVYDVKDANQTYVEDVDYVSWGRNSIRWISVNRPIPGAQYSVRMAFCPTYRVVREFPTVRSSENKLLPRKVGLSLYAFTERDAV